MTVFADSSSRPVVHEARGALVALIIIPIGVVAWGILWNFGFIASIVGFVVAFGAMFLYRLGAGGLVTRLGAALITAITLVTLVLAFFGGMVLDGLKGFSDVTGRAQLSLFFSPQFWDGFFEILNQPGVIGSYAGDFGLALLFGVLGCFGVIRGAFRTASAVATPAGEVVPQTSAAGDAWPTVNTVPERSKDADTSPSTGTEAPQP
jgi:hypothetical protein